MKKVFKAGDVLRAKAVPEGTDETTACALEMFNHLKRKHRTISEAGPRFIRFAENAMPELWDTHWFELDKKQKKKSKWVDFKALKPGNLFEMKPTTEASSERFGHLVAVKMFNGQLMWFNLKTYHLYGFKEADKVHIIAKNDGFTINDDDRPICHSDD